MLVTSPQASIMRMSLLTFSPVMMLRWHLIHRLLEHLNPLFRYAQLINQNRLFYGINPPPTPPYPHIERSWLHDILPTIFMAAMFVLWVSQILQIDLSHWSYCRSIFDFMPIQARQNLMAGHAMASATFLGLRLYAVWSRNLMDYLFLAPLVAQSSVKIDLDKYRITNQDLGLSPDEYMQFSRFRGKCLHHLNRIFTLFVLMLNFSTTKAAVVNGVFRRNFLLGLASTPVAYIYAPYASSAVYAFGVFLFIIFKYIYIKQNSMLAEADSLIKCLCAEMSTAGHQRPVFRLIIYRRFLSLIRRHAKLTSETCHYNQTMKRCLSTLLTGWMAIFTYVSTVLFLTNPPVVQRARLCGHIVIHVSLILGTCFGSARIIYANYALGVKMIRFKNLSLKRNLFSYRSLLKLDTIAQSLIHRPTGFTLSNDVYVTSSTFFTVCYYISTLFFLLLKKTNHIQVQRQHETLFDLFEN